MTRRDAELQSDTQRPRKRHPPSASLSGRGERGGGGGGGEGEGAYSVIALLSHSTIDHACLSRRGTVPTPNRDPPTLGAHYSSSIDVYVKYDPSLFFARCSPAAKCFFSQLRPRGKLGCHGYNIIKNENTLQL